MAIFSLNHSFIGRSGHDPGAAGSHVYYITRAQACTETLGERLPASRAELVRWLDGQEKEDRRNARVIDMVRVALPIELSHEQNATLLRDYCERMTLGRASWFAAIHDGPEDADNPHAHIIFRDRDDAGRRVMMTTEKGSTERFRDGWEQEANIALQRAGRDERIDKRSLEDQGVEREPQIHVGAGAQRMAERDHEFTSNAREVMRIVDGERTVVTINYPAIDQGKSRFEENEERKLRNLELEQLRKLEGMDVVLRASDYLNALTWERGEPPPDDDDLQSFVMWRHLTRYQAKEYREFKEREPEIDEIHEKGPRRDVGDALGGAIGGVAKVAEALFDGFFGERSEREMANDERAKRPNPNVEQQRKLTEEELAASRKALLEAYLEQRERERGIDRGRGR